ncbi:Cytochrome P450 [Sergentomyia squamirostris]
MAYRKENNVHREDIFNVLMDSYQKGSLDGKENFTFTNFLGNAMALFLANFETTSRLVQSCLLELAHNPEIQDRMRNEVRTILQKYNNKITYEAITEMTYVEQALYETMRKYPLLTFLSRNAAEDVKVLGSDVILEKGTLLLISVQGIHYNPDFYPDPEKYDPDRFTYEAIKSRPSCSFLGFGDGPRNCFGSKLGLLQGKLVITNILINYKISPSPKVPYPLRYKSTEYSVLMPDTGCWLIMEKI